LLGKLAWLDAQTLRNSERGIGRKVAVLGLLRPLQLELRGNRLATSEHSHSGGKSAV
jgi:hypothetical protein